MIDPGNAKGVYGWEGTFHPKQRGLGAAPSEPIGAPRAERLVDVRIQEFAEVSPGYRRFVLHTVSERKPETGLQHDVVAPVIRTKTVTTLSGKSRSWTVVPSGFAAWSRWWPPAPVGEALKALDWLDDSLGLPRREGR